MSLLTVAVVSAGAATTGSKVPAANAHAPMQMKCKGEPLNMVKSAAKDECFKQFMPEHAKVPANQAQARNAPQNKGTGKVQAHAQPKKKEQGAKWNENLCMDVCNWKSEGILNAAGAYDSTGAGKMVKEIFPASVQTEMKKAIDDCAAANSKSFSMADDCKGYQQFKECKSKKFMEICDIKKTN